MKKSGKLILALLVCISVCFGLLTVPASAAKTGTIQGTSLTYTIDNDVLTISGTGPMKDYQKDYIAQDYIPGVILNKFTSVVIENGVTSIGDYAFFNMDYITSITIADSVKTIGAGAFKNCDGLQSVILGKGVTEIKEGAFEAMTSLKTITLDDNLKTIGSYAFKGCIALTGVTFPEGVKVVPEDAFNGCTSLASAILSDEATEIKANAFYGCSDLDEIFIPETLKIIGSNAFYGCNSANTVVNIESVKAWCGISFENEYSNPLHMGGKLQQDSVPFTALTIPAGTEKISKYAFYGCKTFKSVEINDSVKEIGEYAFKNCESLISVTLSSNVKEIKEGTFDSCKNLKNFTFNEGIKTIGKDAFKNCTSFETVNLPSTLTTMGESAFEGLRDLKVLTLPSVLENIPNRAFYGCTTISKIVVPSGVKAIGNNAFANCTNLTEFTVYETVIAFGENVLSGCSSLRDLTVPYVGNAAGKTASSKNQYPLGYLFGTTSYTGSYEAKQKFYNANLITKETGKYQIPSTLTSVTVSGGYILDGALENLSSVKTITLGKNVKGLQYAVMNGCGSLETLTVPFVGYTSDTLTSGTVYPLGFLFGDSKYDGSVKVQQDVQNGVGYLAYQIPSMLSTVNILGGEICYGALSNIKSLRSVGIANEVTGMGYGAFSNCTSINNLYIDDLSAWCARNYSNGEGNPLYYAENLYVNNELVTELVIPENITSIGSYAFAGCKSITSVTIHNSVKTVSQGAFYACTALQTVDMGNGVETLGANAFYGCTALKNINISDKLTLIGKNAFSKCSALEKVTVKDLSTWLKITFTNAEANPASLAKCLFIGSSKLTAVAIPEVFEDVNAYAFYNNEAIISLAIPETVKKLGSYAFCGCTGIETLVIPATVEEIGSYTFADCTKVSSLTLNEGLKNIGEGAFRNISKIKTLVIPTTVEKLGAGVLSGWSSLENLTVPFIGESVKTTTSRDQYPLGYLFGKTSYSGSYVASQQYYANLVDDTITEDFYIPTALKSVSVTGGAITTGAFANCEKIENVAFSQSVTEICRYAFKNDKNLKNLSISGNLKSIGDEAFAMCYALENITISEGLESIGARAFKGCEAIESLELPTSLTTIGEEAFAGCTGIETVIIDGGFKSVGSDAFADCLNIDTVTVKNVDAYVATDFGNANANPVTVADKVLFGDAAPAVKLVIGNDVKKIGSYALYALADMESVVLPASVKSIGEGAFDGCESLIYVFTFATEKAWANVTVGENNEEFTGAAIHYETDDHFQVIVPEADPTCLEEGNNTYTYCPSCGLLFSEKIVKEKVPHNYGAITYAWSEDKSTCTASHTCSNFGGHTDIETVQTSWKYSIEPKCESAGEKEITATFTDEAFDTQIFKVPVAKLEHNWSAVTYKWNSDYSECTATRTCKNDPTHVETETVETSGKVTTPATCEEKGVKTFTAEFENTAFTTQYKTEDIKPIEHKWGEATYTWSDDNKTCTATHTCLNDPKHVETEIAESTWKYSIEPKCETDGENEYTAVFKNKLFETQVKKTPEKKLNHDWDEVTYTWSEDGYVCTATHVCKNDPTHVETEEVEAKIVVITPATCLIAGESKCTAEFENKAFETQTTNITVKATGHKWGETKYEWNEDLTECTASHVCTANALHTESETAKVTYKETKVSCQRDGEQVYTAVFENKEFEPAVKKYTTPAVDHSFTNYVSNNDAKLYVDGTETAACDYGCGEAHTRTVEGSALLVDDVFDDVAPDEYYAHPVAWAIIKGITNGTDVNKFSPEETCTRGQIVTFIWRSIGEPEPNLKVNPFSDISKDDYYYKAVLWAYENGITTGTTANTFSPDEGCTRCQVMTFFWRASGSPEVETECPFTDIVEGEYYYKAVLWAYENGITTGTTANTFSPEESCTRGQIVTLLYRQQATPEERAVFENYGKIIKPIKTDD